MAIARESSRPAPPRKCGRVVTYVKVSRARDNQGEGERWAAEQVHPTLNVFDNGDVRCVCAVVHRRLHNNVLKEDCFANSIR